MDGPEADARLAEILRRVVARVRAEQEELFEQIDEAALHEQPDVIVSDPVLHSAVRRSVRSNLSAWLDGVERDPLGTVPPNDALDAVAVAREFHQRGLKDASVVAFRDGQAAAWQRWVELGSELIDDPQELSAFLTHSARSIFAFIDATTAAIEGRLEGRRPQADAATRRQELVTQILDGGSVDPARVQRVLGLRIDESHVAGVVWTVRLDGVEAVLDDAVAAIDRAAGGSAMLEVAHGVATRWIWIGGSPASSSQVLSAAAAAAPAAHVALGLPARGVEGFRRSHGQARAAQRIIGAAGAPRNAGWDELEVVALLLRDPPEARRFIDRTLGDLAAADAELRETVRVYISLGANATRTAEALFTHRNTIIGRIKRADAMLPRPVATDAVRIACALEAARWLPVR